ncbi:hypothetical protein [Kitasatospora sp. HPMI-4]|uniref:hypothetical protein n=1 Tax=Kitasatospora sp. HPMI-4 TaxID=3448443 RepID=UPI003F1CFC59
MFTQFPPHDPEQLAWARTAAAIALERHPGVPAYLSGAPLAGLGTPASDIDLFAVSDRGAGSEQIFVEETRVDLEFVHPANLAELVAGAETFAVAEHDMSQLSFGKLPVLDRLVRFTLGEVLADDRAGTLTALQARARAAADDIGKLVIARLAVDTGNRAEDAFGALAVGDLTSVQYLGRLALIGAAEALLISRGDAYVGPKWVWTRWRRTIGDRLGTRVTEVLHDPAVPAETAFWLGQDLLVHAITGFEYPIVVDPEPHLPRRDPSVTPALTTGPVLLNRQDSRAVRISPQGALLWGAAHGRPRAEAVSLVAGLLGIAESVVDPYYTNLVAAGVLRTDEA